MKFNKDFIYQNSLFIVAFFMLLYMIISSTQLLPEESKKHEHFNTVIIFFLITDILILFGIILEIFTGDIYIEYIYLDINKFKILEYENRTIIVHNNWAWTYIDVKKKISKLEKMKIAHYYNIRRKFKHWKPLPWES